VQILNKADLVALVAKDTGFQKKDTEIFFNSLMNNIMLAVADDERITLNGFGSFLTSNLKARVGRNPKTNELLSIPAKKVARFKVGKEFALAVSKKPYKKHPVDQI